MPPLARAEAGDPPLLQHDDAEEHVVGFTQSYTYFTWKNSRWELTEYVNELAWGEEREYFRPNFFPVTPDILHAYLQHGGPPAFVTRLVLAATLRPSYGIYSGYEHFENVAGPRGLARST